MTAIDETYPGTTPVARREFTTPQWMRVARWFSTGVVADLGLGMAITLGLAATLVLAGAVFVMPWDGWRDALAEWPQAVGLLLVITALVVVLGGALQVMSVVGRYTRPMLRAGATRGSVMAGHYAAVLTVFLLWVLFTAVLLALEPVWSSANFDFTLSAPWLAHGLVILLTLMVIVVIFLRFGAAAALLVLVGWFVVLPLVLLYLPDHPALGLLWPPFAVGPQTPELSGLWEHAATAVQAATCVAIHWLVMRRIPA